MVTGFNHVAIVTQDLDRLRAFYLHVFGIDGPVLDNGPGGARHALLRLGDGAVLHPFEVPDVEDSGPGDSHELRMFHRGRIDHFALDAGDEPTLQQLRRRLMEVGASDGTVTEFGPILSVHFQDPDGTHLEVACLNPHTQARA
jgi:catechol 2,3-dioxygenase-like lactoylglutathione lyase family enzyme